MHPWARSIFGWAGFPAAQANGTTKLRFLMVIHPNSPVAQPVQASENRV
jgi:hypothetical protein